MSQRGFAARIERNLNCGAAVPMGKTRLESARTRGLMHDADLGAAAGEHVESRRPIGVMPPLAA
ncbi:MULTISPECIES: hypothetical protein [unclassified Burkholderia]|uniref:hypothetical protein n=1 Tax=unclassified Burkholderia TaxID=2613784 RepID=UPI000AA039F5|nr:MULTISPECIES: hypothetical protein [unclassified Burkholderia]